MLLVNAGGHISLDRICEELWDGRPTPASAGTVRTYLAQFRRLDVPGGGLTVRPETGGYSVHVEGLDLDATRFEDMLSDGRESDRRTRRAHLEEALALWRGPALVEFQGSHWADQASRRLELLRLQVQQERFEVMIELGEHALCLPELEVAVDGHPLDERLRGQLALARYRTGRIDAALRALSDLRRELVDQLGIGPGPEIEALEARILDRDPSLDARGPVELTSSQQPRLGPADRALPRAMTRTASRSSGPASTTSPSRSPTGTPSDTSNSASTSSGRRTRRSPRPRSAPSSSSGTPTASRSSSSSPTRDDEHGRRRPLTHARGRHPRDQPKTAGHQGQIARKRDERSDDVGPSH